MPNFWASSSSSGSSSDEDSDSDGSVARPPTKGQSFQGTDDEDEDDLSASKTPPAASSTGPSDDNPFSTPPRQPILSVDDPTGAWEAIRPYQVFIKPPTATPDDPSAGTRIVCISDTHGYHRSIPIPPCDILIHGGDFTNYGEPEMVQDVSDYFYELQQNGTVRERIICIAGNHELTFEPDHYDRVWRRFQRPRRTGKYDADAARKALTNCTYLEDDAVTIGGIHFFGSPWQPEFYDWAFNVPRADIDSRWERIPTMADVLITHGPPLGRGDVTSGNNRVGCVSLMKEVQYRIKPRLHVFGHVHEGYGVTHDGTTMFVNASSVSHNYTRQNPSIVVDLPYNPEMPARLVKPNCRLDTNGLLEWLHRNGYDKTAARCEEVEDKLTGKEFVEDSHDELCCRLVIHRDEEAKAELKEATTKLWAESFN